MDIGVVSLNYDFNCELCQIFYISMNHPTNYSEISSVILRFLLITPLPDSASRDLIRRCSFLQFGRIQMFLLLCFWHQWRAGKVCLKQFKMLVMSLEEMLLSESNFCTNITPRLLRHPPLCFSRISLNEGLQWEKYERLCICVCVPFNSDKNWVVFRKVARQDSPSTLNMCHLESLLIILKYPPLSDNLLNSLVRLRQWWPIELLKQTATLFIFYQAHL